MAWVGGEGGGSGSARANFKWLYNNNHFSSDSDILYVFRKCVGLMGGKCRFHKTKLAEYFIKQKLQSISENLLRHWTQHLNQISSSR